MNELGVEKVQYCNKTRFCTAVAHLPSPPLEMSRISATKVNYYILAEALKNNSI